MAAGTRMMRIAEDSRPRTTKNVYVYKNGDRYFSGIRVPVNLRRYRTVDALLDDLTAKIPGLNRGARVLSTSRGKHSIRELNQLEHLGSYFCSDQQPSRLPKFSVKQIITNPIEYQFRGSYRAVNDSSASKTNSKATLSGNEGTITTITDESFTSLPTVRRQKRTKSLPARKYESDSSKNTAPEPKQRKKLKKKKKKTAAEKYEIADISTYSDSVIESAQTTLSDMSGVSLSPHSRNRSSVAQSSGNDESASERTLSRAQSEPGDKPRKILEKRNSVDKSLSPLDKSKLKHKQRIKVNVKKAWSPEDLPDFEDESNETSQMKERQLTATVATSPALEPISINERKQKAIQDASASKIQRFYRDYSNKKYGPKNNLQSGTFNDANIKDNDEFTEADVDIDDGERFAAIRNERNEIATRRMKDSEEISPSEFDITERATEAEIAKEGSELEAESELERRIAEEKQHAADFANTTANNEAAIKIQTALRNRLAQKEAEHKTSLRKAEVESVSPVAEPAPLSSVSEVAAAIKIQTAVRKWLARNEAQRRRLLRTTAVAPVLSATDVAPLSPVSEIAPKNEAAIKVQTTVRNRLAQKEAERRTALRTAEVAPVAPADERPLSSYRP